MLQLTSAQRSFLRALAHPLNPTVMIGGQGLTEAVIKELDNSLNSHELIKVRVLGDDREARNRWYEEICATLEASPVQHIGKLFVLYRPAAEPKIALPKDKK